VAVEKKIRSTFADVAALFSAMA
ncbi:hypothetical protein Tco_1128198, partial [Tanacetum coccineum]